MHTPHRHLVVCVSLLHFMPDEEVLYHPWNISLAPSQAQHTEDVDT